MENSSPPIVSDEVLVQSTNIPIKPRKAASKILILLIMLVVITIGLGGYFLGFRKNNKAVVAVKPTASAPTTQTSPSSPVQLHGKIFSGHVQKLDKDLGLIVPRSYEVVNNLHTRVTYYSAGTYMLGPYKGYVRYLAIREAIDPTGPNPFFFASGDGKSYILDGDPIKAKELFSNGINQTKVQKVDHLPFEHPDSINLTPLFALRKNHVAIEEIPYNSVNQSGDPVVLYTEQLSTDFSVDMSLSSSIPYLSLYAKPYQIKNYQIPSPTPSHEQQYIVGTTAVLVVDSAGVAYTYDQAHPAQASEYTKQLADYYTGTDAYQKAGDYKKQSPQYPLPPDLALKKSEIQSSVPLYDTYSVAFPESCATDVNSLIVKNISDSELQKIGTSPDGDIYILQNKEHALYHAAYQNKTRTSDEDFLSYNNYQNSHPFTRKPTFQEYMSQYPFIFFKDSWGRWVMLGEYDIKMPGGCGKPVIYLYPPEPTHVSIQFLTPISFDVDIPSYHDGWNVLAQPDGTLTDLQPEFTDCSGISNKFGSEYAKSACQKNRYPYLYWAGRSTDRNYPEISNGWIVARDDVEHFINQTLDTVGFTKKEKSDFTAYWIPEMLSHPHPYFRISFLQNNEMNEIAPMRVIPVPDHYYRYFLDYLPLDAKPRTSLVPENLSKIIRNGFTLVEWGGHLR